MSPLKKIENIQDKACIVATGAIQGTHRECLYQEISLKSLEDTRYFQKLFFFFKLRIAPKYLTNYLI